MKEGAKVDLTVERDDLVGEEDQIELALHMTRNGKEDTTLPFIPRATFSMKMESDVWRLNEISVTVRLPLADPDFLKNIEGRQRSQSEQMTMWAIREVTTAEKSYQSANGAFACSLTVLGSNKGSQGEGGFLFDRELATGKKGGYIFAISGCNESQYKIVAEPAASDSAQRAFCSDESGTIRAADDGKATSCLSSGEPVMVNAEGSIPTGPNAPNVEVPRHEVKRIRVSEGVSQALVTTRVRPVSPGDANKIQGQVVLAATISTTGDVLRLQVISGLPILTPAAINAASQWKYRPYLLNGEPVEIETQITMNFSPSNH